MSLMQAVDSKAWPFLCLDVKIEDEVEAEVKVKVEVKRPEGEMLHWCTGVQGSAMQ